MRKKKNKSGSTSIQIIDKTGGTYRVIKTLGASRDIDEIERLVQLGTSIINKADDNQPRLFTVKTETEQAIENFCQGLSNNNIRTIGPELIFGTLFDRIGFNKVDDELLPPHHHRQARLSNQQA
ncbi:hypothetical protein [Candidatus Aquicultor secundus]|uniref:hypothetical protein n=1 Tax=Candidatus Aquicultor secundus TaxID=1973895 RepID=UPI00257E71D6|nr:hypothetical protein [Candidatus Aquicultor secundus]